MSAHTPGPWQWIGYSAVWGARGQHDQTVIELGDDGKSYGMHRAVMVHNADDAMAEANRRLIAAAPELYEIVRKLAALRNGLQHSSRSAEDAATELAEKAEQLIAKVSP